MKTEGNKEKNVWITIS